VKSGLSRVATWAPKAALPLAAQDSEPSFSGVSPGGSLVGGVACGVGTGGAGSDFFAGF